MNFEFNKWQKNFSRLIGDLKGIFEEEFQAIIISKISDLNDVQERKTKLLDAYETCVIQGKSFEESLKALPQKQKELWLKDIEEIHALGDRNLKMIQQFIKEREQALADFHQWLQRPSSKGPYVSNKEIALGLDRRT